MQKAVEVIYGCVCRRAHAVWRFSARCAVRLSLQEFSVHVSACMFVLSPWQMCVRVCA